MAGTACSGRSTARAILCVAFLGASSTIDAAEPARAEENYGALSFVLENDLFYGNDRNYTNGVRLSWLSAPGRTPELAMRAARTLPFFPEGGTVRTGYAIGQSMYAPTDITVPNPPLTDRPYAGWLYGSIALIAENGRRLDQLDLSLGVVGPASLAEQSQKFVHHLINTRVPRGWDTQLHNEPGAVLTYERSWRRIASLRWVGFDFDLAPHVGGAVGNVFTYLNTGLTARLGSRLSLDYGPPRIQPTLPGSGFFVPRHNLGWYVFAGVDGRAVAHNIFLDGNTFRDSRSVDKERWVGDLQWGVAVTWRTMRVSYTHVVRTREFRTQGEHDEFGAVTLTIAF